MKSASDLNDLCFLLAIVWTVCSFASLGTLHSMAHSAETSSLPTDKQCQALLNQASTEQQAAIKPQIEGWCLIITPNKGNCLACHDIDIKPWPAGLSAAGNIAPILTNIANRFANQRTLKNIIYDAASKNPQTVMPLFGEHHILTEPEIARIVTFLMTLR